MFVVMFVAGTQSGSAWRAFVRRAWAEFSLSPRKCPSGWAGCRRFMDPERFKEDAGLQQMQALIAWGSGGMEGLGLGNGRQKMLYLPYAHTDFIFPMIGEELGLRVSLARRVSVRRHHRLRNDDRAACEGSFRLAARLRHRFAARLAGGGQHRCDHIAFAEQGLAAAVHQLRRIQSGACLFGVGCCSNIYRQGSARAGEQETHDSCRRRQESTTAESE